MTGRLIIVSLFFLCFIIYKANGQEKELNSNTIDTALINNTINNTNLKDSLLKIVQLTDASQEADSIPVVIKKTIFNFKHDYNKAAFLSAVLPGSGQFYNKQYYKTPVYPSGIVLGLAAGLKFKSEFNDTKDRIAVSEDPDERVDLRRTLNKNRNLANAGFVLSAFSYGAGIADAFISAKIKSNPKNSDNFHNPAIATYRSAILPGYGQFYNKQGWKSIFIYGGLIASGVAIGYSMQRKNCYKNIYLDRNRYGYVDSVNLNRCFSENEIPIIESFDDSRILSEKQFHDPNLQRSILIFSGVYFLNIIDAFVFGHLYNFKTIEEDLEVRLSPYIQSDLTGNNTLGLKLNIKI